jgi:hypothetical protein
MNAYYNSGSYKCSSSSLPKENTFLFLNLYEVDAHPDLAIAYLVIPLLLLCIVVNSQREWTISVYCIVILVYICGRK